MVIRPKNKVTNLNEIHIKIGNVYLSRVGNDCKERHIKFLGLLIDENLTWTHHIAYVNQKLSKSLFFMSQLKHLFNTYCLRMLYFAFIFPHLLYGLICWGNIQPSSLKQTFLYQKRAIRIVCKSKYNSHTDPLFKTQILKVYDLVHYISLKFMYDYKNSLLPYSFNDTFILNRQLPNSRTTRQSEFYHLPKTRTDYISKFPLYTIPKIWNKWFNIVNSAKNVRQFKKITKEKFLEPYSNEKKCHNRYCQDCNPR